jgi:hypothetical protein
MLFQCFAVLSLFDAVLPCLTLFVVGTDLFLFLCSSSLWLVLTCFCSLCPGSFFVVVSNIAAGTPLHLWFAWVEKDQKQLQRPQW